MDEDLLYLPSSHEAALTNEEGVAGRCDSIFPDLPDDAFLLGANDSAHFATENADLFAEFNGGLQFNHNFEGDTSNLTKKMEMLLTKLQDLGKMLEAARTEAGQHK